MAITVNLNKEKFAEQQARERGYADASAYVNALLDREQQQTVGPKEESTREWIERIRGTATSGLTTDEFMKMTRSEV